MRDPDEEYSFLKKQTVGSHVLNLGFASSFRSNFRVEEPEMPAYNSSRSTLGKEINLYETFGREIAAENYMLSSSLMKKKPEIMKEVSRKSSTEVMKMLNSPLSGTNLKQKRESIQQIISMRGKTQQQPRVSIQIKKRLSTLPAYLRKSLMSKKSVAIRSTEIAVRSIGLFHHNPALFRQLPSFRISTPKLSLLDGINPFQETKEQCQMSFKDLLGLIHQSEPVYLDKKFLDMINVFIVDEKTAIPYIVLSRTNLQGDMFSDNRNSEANREVLIVALDFFDNFLNHIGLFNEFVSNSPNLSIIMFNYPGQAYTLFANSKEVYNNEFNGVLLDLLLFELQKKGEILVRSDNFRMVGFGNGANILCFFISLHDGTLVNIRSFLAFNPFLYIDDMLADILGKSIEVFRKFPIESPELCFIYEETMCSQISTKPEFSLLEARLQENPISVEGRIAILNGVLSSINVSQNVHRLLKNQIRVVFSQKNPLVNVTQLDLLLKGEEGADKRVDFFKGFRNETAILDWFANKEPRQAVVLEEGGHNLLKDQRSTVKLLIRSFIRNEAGLAKSLSQKIAFLDVKIARLEKKVVEFFVKFVEKNIEFTEDPFDEIHSLTKLSTIFELYREKFFRTLRENEANTQELEWIMGEYKRARDKIQKNVEEFDEFMERNEKTMNIQTKKLSDLKSNLTRIASEFLEPFRNAMKGLMFYKLLGDIGQALDLHREYLASLKSFQKDEESEDIVINNSNDSKEGNMNTLKNPYEPRNSLERKLKPSLNPSKRFVSRKSKLAGFLLKSFQKLAFLTEIKEEVVENFPTEDIGFESLESEVMEGLRGLFSEAIEFELLMANPLTVPPDEIASCEDSIDVYRQMFFEMSVFVEGFSLGRAEELLMFEGLDEDPLATARATNPDSMNNIITESNISEFSSHYNIASMRNIVKNVRKYRDGVTGNEEEFGKKYREVFGRKWLEDEERLKEMERKVEERMREKGV